MAGERTARVPLFTRTERFAAWTVGVIIVLGLISLGLWSTVVLRIPPGYVGVRYSLLFGGTVTSYTLPEGIAEKLPWDSVNLYNVRVQKLPFHMTALSSEGLSAEIDGTLLYRARPDKAGLLQKQVGPDYRDQVILPETLATLREVTAKYRAEELYSIDYHKLRSDVVAELRASHISDMVDFISLDITKVVLPQDVTSAIESKITQAQVAATYQFRLLSAKREAERLRIKAIGLRTYYTTVRQALDKTLLTWRGIEATVELAQSPNTKIVVVGGGANQMPLILGGDIAKTPDTTAAERYKVSPGANASLDFSNPPALFPSSQLNPDGSGGVTPGSAADGSGGSPTSGSGN